MFKLSSLVAHFVGDDVDRLVVAPLVDGAAVGVVAHPGNPGQADHGVVPGLTVVKVQPGQQKAVVPIAGVAVVLKRNLTLIEEKFRQGHGGN